MCLNNFGPSWRLRFFFWISQNKVVTQITKYLNINPILTSHNYIQKITASMTCFVKLLYLYKQASYAATKIYGASDDITRLWRHYPICRYLLIKLSDIRPENLGSGRPTKQSRQYLISYHLPGYLQIWTASYGWCLGTRFMESGFGPSFPSKSLSESRPRFHDNHEKLKNVWNESRYICLLRPLHSTMDVKPKEKPQALEKAFLSLSFLNFLLPEGPNWYPGSETGFRIRIRIRILWPNWKSGSNPKCLFTTVGILIATDTTVWQRKTKHPSSVADSDVFWSPGSRSGSISPRYGSGAFDHQAKIVKKLDSCCFVTFLWLFIFKIM
jgi:hypothetical protein